ncbi:Response regulator UvrY [Methylophilaceae bacterium]|nr:Response regulator UvrY [Methylophilaceae bacterium]
MSQDNIRIILVDDHAVVRSGLRRLLEQKPGMEVVAEAESGEQAYQLFTELLPDVVVMDLSMPGMGGLEALRRILGRSPQARVVVFSMHENAAFAYQALSMGAKSYVAKSGMAEDLIHAVKKAAVGGTYISPAVAQKMALQSVSGEDTLSKKLSAREFEVFRLIAEGNSAEDIGRLLNISQKTVANYQTMIRQKLGVNSPVELVRLAIRHGLIES